MNKNEQQDEMVYYDVPQECILLDEVEQLLIGKDVEIEGWAQINFTMQYGEHFGFLKDSSNVPINSAEFLSDFLWELKEKDETIKIREHIFRHAPTVETRLCETKAIMIEPSQMLNFFVKPEERCMVKAIMAKYAEETEYYTYEAGLDE